MLHKRLSGHENLSGRFGKKSLSPGTKLGFIKWSELRNKCENDYTGWHFRDGLFTGNCQGFTATLPRENQSHTRCRYKRNIDAHSYNHNCRGKTISITCSEYVSVALGTQHAKPMYRNYISTAACPAIPCFSTLSYNRHDFRGEGWRGELSNIKCRRPATSWVHYTTNCNTQSSAPEDG